MGRIRLRPKSYCEVVREVRNAIVNNLIVGAVKTQRRICLSRRPRGPIRESSRVSITGGVRRIAVGLRLKP